MNINFHCNQDVQVSEVIHAVPPERLCWRYITITDDSGSVHNIVVYFTPKATDDEAGV